MRRNKFGNRKIVVDGKTYDSLKEYRAIYFLRMRERAGEIRDLQTQVRFELAPAVRFVAERRKKPALRYYADATYIENATDQYVVLDAKSEATRRLSTYRAKKQLMLTVHGIEILEV